MIALCRGIMLRRRVPSHRVLAHSDVAPARKKDPGEKFPWHSLANSGVGHWVQPAPIVRGETLKLGTISDDVYNMQRALAKYGYGIATNGKYDGPTMEVVTAFQRHFRPARVDGIADHSTMITLQSLLESLPADASRHAGASSKRAQPQSVATIGVWIPGLRQAAHPGTTKVGSPTGREAFALRFRVHPGYPDPPSSSANRRA